MLSKEDFKGYLEELSFFESNMFYVYKTCVDKVEDSGFKKICANLAKEEAEHDVIVKKLKKLIENKS